MRQTPRLGDDLFCSVVTLFLYEKPMQQGCCLGKPKTPFLKELERGREKERLEVERGREHASCVVLYCVY